MPLRNQTKSIKNKWPPLPPPRRLASPLSRTSFWKRTTNLRSLSKVTALPIIVQSHRQARMYPLMLPEWDDGNAPTNEDVQAWQVRNSAA